MSALEEHLTKHQHSIKLPKSPGSENAHTEPPHLFDNRMIRRAITLSQFALTEPDMYEPFGAVVVRNSDRKLLSEYVSGVGKSKDPSAHAILLAVRDSCKFLNKEHLEECTLYSSFEPCAMCTALIHTARLSRVVYACPMNEVLEFIDFTRQFDDVRKPIHERSIPAVSLASKEAADVIRSWYRRDELSDS